MVLPKTGAGTANPSPVLRASLNRGKIGATSKRLTTESPEDIALEEAYINRGRKGIGRVLRNRKTTPPVVGATPTPPAAPKVTTPDTTPTAVEIVDPKGEPTKATSPIRFFDGEWWDTRTGTVLGNKYVRQIGGFLPRQVWAMGAVNPFPEFAGTKGMKWTTRLKTGAGPGIMRILAPFIAQEAVLQGSSATSTITQGEWGTTEEERLNYLTKTIVETQGYPEDVARELAGSLNSNIMSRLATAVGYAGDQAINDMIVIAIATLIGGVAGGVSGAAAGGVGAIPGVGIGASRGYLVGRGIVGTSNLLNLAELALTLQNGKEYVDLPTVDDFSPWTAFNKSQPFFDLNNNGVQDTGEDTNPNYEPEMESGKGALGDAFGDIFSTSQQKAWENIMLKYPERFVSPQEALLEEGRYKTGYYNQPGKQNPRIGEVVTLISQGYFVYKNSQGDWALNHDAVKSYLENTTRYKTMADKMAVINWLWEGRMVPDKEFLSTIPKGINQETYNSLWYNDID